LLTGRTVRTLRIAFTKNLGAFVERAIPIIGFVMLASDAVEVMLNSVRTYKKSFAQKIEFYSDGQAEQ
jgi:hypothetical protein